MKMPELKRKYTEEVAPALLKDFGWSNSMMVPKLQKIVLNMGLGEAVQDPKIIDIGVYTLTRITGQKPVVTRAKKSISTFKLREGLPIGCSVTLRGNRMFEFMERLVHFSLPRMRDFNGLSKKSFDGHGNYNFGLKDQLIFPEIDFDKIDRLKGMNITFVSSTSDDKEAEALLRGLGLPLKE